jgi:hypothetical protein
MVESLPADQRVYQRRSLNDLTCANCGGGTRDHVPLSGECIRNQAEPASSASPKAPPDDAVVDNAQAEEPLPNSSAKPWPDPADNYWFPPTFRGETS